MPEQVLLLCVHDGDLYVSTLHRGRFLGGLLWDLVGPIDSPIPQAPERPHLLPTFTRLRPFHVPSLCLLPQLYASVSRERLPNRAPSLASFSHLAIANYSNCRNDGLDLAILFDEVAPTTSEEIPPKVLYEKSTKPTPLFQKISKLIRAAAQHKYLGYTSKRSILKKIDKPKQSSTDARRSKQLFNARNYQ